MDPPVVHGPPARSRKTPAIGPCTWRIVLLGFCLSQSCPGNETFLTPRPRPQPPRSQLRAHRAGWLRLNKRASWDFLLGASPFSYEEVVSSQKQEEYMKNLLWIDDLETEPMETPENQSSTTSAEYPPAFIAYLARLLLARDERCAAWWAGAKTVGTETPQEVFARFEASVAKTLSERWSGKAGALAAALIKRFGGRFPFDAEQQIRLCFGLLPEDILRGSFFDQNFSTDRDEVMEVFLAMDRDGNGMLTREEIQEAFQSIGDGWLSKPEVEQMLKEALADSNGEVDVAGFKAAVAASLTAPRARAAQGLPDAEWWRDPAALLPAPMLDHATPSVLQEAYDLYMQDRGMQAQPLQREKPLNLRIYALFTLAGALACTMTHVALVPLDVVKTLQQTEPSRFGGLGLLGTTHRLLKESGASALFLGFWPTMAGYTWYGASVFPGYELFKRKLMEVVGPRRAASFRVPTILLAGAMATFFACIGVAPAEAVRIRTVAERGFSSDFLHPFTQLFAGFPPLLLRQVFFGMAKFLVFDTVAAMVYRQFPWMANRKRTSSMVSMFSGALAGIISTFVSQPADAILTCMSATPQLGIAGAASRLWSEGQFGAFYAGFSTRAAWAAAIIGGQFLLYDVAKRIFKVTHGDLSQTADALSTALRNEKVFQPAATSLAGGPRTVSATSRRFVQGRRPPILVGRSWLRRIRCRFLRERL